MSENSGDSVIREIPSEFKLDNEKLLGILHDQLTASYDKPEIKAAEICNGVLDYANSKEGWSSGIFPETGENRFSIHPKGAEMILSTRPKGSNPFGLGKRNLNLLQQAVQSAVNASITWKRQVIEDDFY